MEENVLKLTDDNNSIKLRDAFLKLKLNFSQVFVMQEGGIGINHYFDINPKDFLRFAKKDNIDSDVRGRINAITNAKRAIDCQTDKILSLFGFEFDKTLPKRASEFIKVTGKVTSDEKHSLKLIAALGIAPTLLISKVRKLRHSLEHYYNAPTVDETNEAIDLAELYINATENKVDTAWDITFGNDENTLDRTPYKGVYLCYSEGEKGVILRFPGVKKEIDPLTFYNSDLEFYYLLKMTICSDDEEVLSDCFSKLLICIDHPQSKLKVNAISYQ